MDSVLSKIQKIIETDFANFSIILMKYFYGEEITRVADNMIRMHGKYCHLLFRKEDGVEYGYNVISYKEIEELIHPDQYEVILRLCRPAKDDIYKRIQRHVLLNDTLPTEDDDPDLYSRIEILMDSYRRGLLSKDEKERYESFPRWKWECSRLSSFGIKCMKLYEDLIIDHEYDEKLYKEVVRLYKSGKMSPYLMSIFASILPV